MLRFLYRAFILMQSVSTHVLIQVYSFFFLPDSVVCIVRV